MTKQIISASKVISLAIVLSFGLSYVYAWTAPSTTPPTGNVSAPINTGDNTQYKAGNLVLNDSILPFTNGLIVRYGNVGIGTSDPRAKLDVIGEIKIGNTSSVCNTTNEGQQRYNSASKSMEFCNGTTWVVIGMGNHGVKAFTTAGTTSWTVPAGVTTVWITAAGGGGGGGTGDNWSIPGAGGGGGAAGLYDKVTVVPGQDITIIVGNGGPGSTSVSSPNGGPGEKSCFGAVCYAGGFGAAGTVPGAAGGPGGVKGGYGSPLYSYGYTGGPGGGTIIGAGGTTSDYPQFKNGVPGGLYGGGGGGGSTNGLGANGAQGGVFVIW